MSKVAKFWEAMGGRKQFNGYLMCIFATVMAPELDPTFVEYISAIGAALLGTSGLIVVEDVKKAVAERIADDAEKEAP